MIQLKTTSYMYCVHSNIFNFRMNSNSHHTKTVVIIVTFSLGSLLLELRNKDCLEIIHLLKSNIYNIQI